VNTPSLFDAKYERRAEERKAEIEQAHQRALADDFHAEIRAACDVIGRKSRLAHKLRDPKFYTARTKRAVNSLTVERGPKGGAA
jgi:hypothetical protein